VNIKNRVKKTIHKRLEDLDDHLFLLSQALDGLENGENAYLKTLAAELRVLVCFSSGTEGLLWRLAEDLGVPDAVNVHLPGELNREHPLASGLQFMFMPIFRVGEGDPRLPPALFHLKGIIKECSAVYVLGQCFTHEQLIKSVAQQMGSAHEDDGVDPCIAELHNMEFSGANPIVKILSTDASLILEMGECVIKKGIESHNFRPKQRRKIVYEHTECGETHLDSVEEFEQDFKISPEGSVFFSIDHPHKDWATNSNEYQFGDFKNSTLRINTVKHSDCTIEISIFGLQKSPIVTRNKILHNTAPRYTIAITWTISEINVYLSGSAIDTIKY